ADDLIGGTEVERVAGAFDGVPLHLVLGGGGVELGVQGGHVLRLAEVAGGDRGAEVPALRGSRGAEGARRAGGAGPGRPAGRRRAEDQRLSGAGAQVRTRASATVGGVVDHFDLFFRCPDGAGGTAWTWWIDHSRAMGSRRCGSATRLAD